MSESTPPVIAKFVDFYNIEHDAIDILKIVRPKWIDEWEKGGVEIKSEELTGGITNKIACFYRDDDHEAKDVVIIKVFGKNTYRMIDKALEAKAMSLLSKNGCGPKLYATFENGQCYQLLHGIILNPANVRSPEVYPLVAIALAKFHKNMPLHEICNSYDSEIWDTMRRFLILLKDSPQLEELKRDYHFDLATAYAEVEKMEDILEDEGIPIAFCHNDLLLGNIIYNDHAKTISFVDYEYAMPNYIAFDVANHFNEFGGIHKPDFSKCPDSKFKHEWIEIYLQHLFQDSGSAIDQILRPFSVDEFEKWVDLCIPASHLFWALWAAVQADQSDLDFDFANYFGLRWSEYKKHVPTDTVKINGKNKSVTASIVPCIVILIVCLLIICIIRFYFIFI